MENISQNEKVMKNAQYRKSAGIAFFNATNSAIEMVKAEGKQYKVVKKGGKNFKKLIPTEDRIEYWKQHFLTKYTKYYGEVIANIGMNYIAKDTIEMLNKCKTKEEFIKSWLSLSEDERRDGDIIKTKDLIKAKFIVKQTNEKA
jgi:hypothetical protein